MAGTITVKAGKNAQPEGTLAVAFHERHPDHPGKEAFVAGDKEARVAKTDRVQKALDDGVLVEVKGKAAEPKGEKAEKADS